MNANSRSRGRGAGAVLVTLGLAAYGLLGVGAAEPAAAAPVSLNLTYSCVFPVIGKKQLKVAIKSDVPARLPVGVSMPRVVFDTTTTVPEDTANGLLSVGAETMEGGALAQAVLTVPEYPDGIAIKTGAQFPRTFIPPAGSFDVRAV
ncbi:MAG: DUF6801 domain-containing protein, partial [Streptosporangiaceae bacterium]